MATYSYQIEFVNETGEEINISFSTKSALSSYGIFTLKNKQSGESSHWGLTGCGPSTKLYPENRHIREFKTLEFFHAPNSSEAFKKYDYSSAYKGHIREYPLVFEEDDSQFLYALSPDGSFSENLFVKSDERPFYLERDAEAPNLARLIITYVPQPD